MRAPENPPDFNRFQRPFLTSRPALPGAVPSLRGPIEAARRGYPKKQLPMWHQYRVELYPHYGQLSGIRDKFGNELEFPSAFRLSRRDGKPRGIIKIGESS